MFAMISADVNVLRFWESFWRSCKDEFRNLSFGELAIYALMCAIVVHLVFYIRARVTGKTIYLYQELLWIALVVYALFIAYITLMIRVDGSSGKVFSTDHLRIQKSMDQNMTNLLNIILFIPFGALIAFVWEKKSRWLCVLMAGVYSFLFSICIETIQYVTARGYFELDDIEANFLGGIIGASVICLLGKIFNKRKS